MRGIIKTFIYGLGYGVSFCIPRKHPRVSVLMYHSVENSDWKYGVFETEFEKQMKYLMKNKTIVPFADVVAYARGEKDLPDNSVCITFDDGYKDTIDVVAPLLKEHKIPATVFLTTDLNVMDKLGNLERPEWGEVGRVAREGWITFEVHGKTHTNFNALSQIALIDEIMYSKNTIEQATGYSPRYVAYPAGRVTSGVESVVRNNFEGACVITEGMVQKNANPYRIKRIQVDRSISFSQFKLRMTGALRVVKGVKGIFHG